MYKPQFIIKKVKCFFNTLSAVLENTMANNIIFSAGTDYGSKSKYCEII